MKQKALSWLLALCLIVGLLPTAALAAENDVDTGTPVVSAVTALQERINALPDADTLAEMDEDEQAEVYAEVCDIYDAIDELTPEEGKALDVSALEEAAAFFTQQIMPLDEGDNDTVMFGTCGATEKDSVNWALTKNSDGSTYTLTISGEGAMADYKSNIRNSNATQPWRAGQTGIDVEKITKIVVKPGVTKIGAFAFNGITNVTEYDIAATVADIGKWGLETSSVEHFYLNENPNYTVDDGVLLNADKTELIAYPGGAAPRDSYTIPSTVTTVAFGAFVGCDAAKLVIPSTVTTLPQWSFNGGTIEEIVCEANMGTLPDSVFASIEELKKISFGSTIKTLPKQAVYGCPKLCDVTLPDGLTSIGEQAYMKCTALSDIEFPASLKSIGNQAFISCTALSGIEFPEGLETIGSQAFYHCSALTALVIPDSLTTIGGSAFSGCTGLKYVVHGSGIDNIGGSAFSDCTSLKVIDIHRAEKIGEVWDNGHRVDGDPTLNHACESTLKKVSYYMRNETQAKSAKGNIEWGNGGPGKGNTTNTYYVLTEKDAVPDYSATTNTPLRTGYTFSGWKEVHVDNPENVDTHVYTDDGQWQKNSYTADEKTATITQKVGDTSNGSATLKAPEERVYDGQPEAAGVETTGTWTGGKNVTYAKKGENEYTDNAPVAAGTYTAQLTVGKGEAAVTVSVEFEITKAQPTVSISADKTSLQGGGRVKLTVSGVPEGGTVTVTQTDDQGSKAKTLDLTENGNISVSLSNTTAKYTFTASYAGGANHKASSATCDVSVTRYTSGGGGTTTYTVTTDSAKNGSVSVSPKNASKGATVTITVKPDSGYELDDLTVTDKNGKTVKVTEGKNGKYTFTMPASKVTVEASFTKIKEEPKVSFADVSTSAYYAAAVAWAVENGVTGGTSATTFSPDAACTRAQAVTFLWRAAGSPAPKSSVNPFPDVSTSAYYYDAVLWAVERGITAGTSATTFSPDATCTRGQIVTFLYRAVGTTTSGTNPFVDVADSAYYADAVKWAVAEGVTAGTSATTFSPDASCTRGQIVTFLYRAYA